MSEKHGRNPLRRVFSAGKSGSSDNAQVGQLQEEIRGLRQSVETLSVLSDLAVAMGTAHDPEAAIEKLVDRSMRAVQGEQAVVTLIDEDDASAGQTQLRVQRSSVQQRNYRIDESLLGWMFLNNKPLLITDPKSDERFQRLKWDENIRSVMCLPLMITGRLIGVLTIYNKRDADAFSEEDLRMMSIIGGPAAQIIDNSRLAQDNSRMAEQVRLAYDIQMNLLPKENPRIDGYDIAGRSVPAQSVGGDYFDFIPIDDTNIALCLGDATGKGLPASLVMANVQATLRGQTLVEAPVSERIARANKLLYQSTDDERFVTLFYGVLDSTNHTVEFCNAGHEKPIVFAPDGSSRHLELGGLALGVLDDMAYEQETITLAPGELLMVYSDGITDAISHADEMLGAERFEALVREQLDKPVDAMIERVFQGVAAHAGAVPQFDDLTLIAARRSL